MINWLVVAVVVSMFAWAGTVWSLLSVRELQKTIEQEREQRLAHLELLCGFSDNKKNKIDR
jgi:hypothetical protein